MTEEEAHRLAEFVHDHDKRFEAKAQTEGTDSFVLLTQIGDGMTLDLITSLAQHQVELVERDDPGPTVGAAWTQWQPSDAGR